MDEPIIKKELYFFYQEIGFPYEGLVDFGDGNIAQAIKVVQIYKVQYNKYKHSFFATRNDSVCIMNLNSEQTDEYYTVKPGDTLSSIAIRYKVTAYDLARWNRIADPNKIEAGQTLVIKKTSEAKDSGNETKTLNNVNTVIGIAGTYFSTIAGIRYTDRPGGGGYFRTAKGKFYDLSALDVQPSGKYLKGVQGIRNAANTAKNATRFFRGFGNIAGVATIGISGYEFYTNPNWRNGLNIVGGVISFVFWEAGWALMYVNTVIDYHDENWKNVQTQVDIMEGNGKFKELSIGQKLSWLMMFSGGSLTGPSGGF